MKKRLIVVLLTALLLSSMAVISFASYGETAINRTLVGDIQLTYDETNDTWEKVWTVSLFTQDALYQIVPIVTNTDTETIGDFHFGLSNGSNGINNMGYTSEYRPSQGVDGSITVYINAHTGNSLQIFQYTTSPANSEASEVRVYIYRINSVGATEAYENGKADGLTEGYNNGYEVGYENGKADGLTEGYNNGYTVGNNEGYNNGYTVGYNEGYDQLIDESDSAYARGYRDGKEVGLAEGQSVNEVIGNAMDGFFNGVAVFLEPFMSLGIGVLTIRNLMFLLCATAIGVFIVKIVRG